jgi:hypothetical protein
LGGPELNKQAPFPKANQKDLRYFEIIKTGRDVKTRFIAGC